MAEPFDKDPAAKLDYTVNWADWMAAGDTITGATWSASGGTVTFSGDTHTPTAATTFIEGGTVGDKITVTNRITTAQGRIDERSFIIRIKER